MEGGGVFMLDQEPMVSASLTAQTMLWTKSYVTRLVEGLEWFAFEAEFKCCFSLKRLLICAFI